MSGTVFNTLPLALNVTVPCGTTEPLAVTAAVKVIALPRVEGFADDVSVVVVPAGTTDCATELPLVANAAAPPYVAVMVWLPELNEDKVKLATPPLKAADPSGV